MAYLLLSASSTTVSIHTSMGNRSETRIKKWLFAKTYKQMCLEKSKIQLK